MFRDRSARLVLGGVLAVGAGGAALVFALLYAALSFVELPGAAGLVDARSAAAGSLVYGLVGAAFVVVGLGSALKRRWARPLMLTLAWTWLLGGFSVLLFLPVLSAVALAEIEGEVLGVLWVLAVGGGVLLPALLIWVYAERDLQSTCEALDPRPAWTDRCPAPVLGLSLGLAACSVLALVSALRPAVPLFGRLVTGWPGAALLVASAVLGAWLARATFALRWTGWWGVSAGSVLLGVSTWVTLRSVPSAEIYGAMGVPQGAGLDIASGNTLALWLTVLGTLATLVYMAWIRKYF